MKKEPDRQIRPQLAQHRRHKLQLIVLHPDSRSVRGATRGFLGEPLVDRDIGVPPRPLERRSHQNVVVERPQRVVGEPLVVLGEVLRGQLDGKQTKAVNHYRIDLLVRDPRPAEPRRHPAVAGWVRAQ